MGNLQAVVPAEVPVAAQDSIPSGLDLALSAWPDAWKISTEDDRRRAKHDLDDGTDLVGPRSDAALEPAGVHEGAESNRVGRADRDSGRGSNLQGDSVAGSDQRAGVLDAPALDRRRRRPDRVRVQPLAGRDCRAGVGHDLGEKGGSG